MTETLPCISSIISMLAARREIAIIWSVEDVLIMRPDLSDDSAWAVLQACDRHFDSSIGITWDVIEDAADELFPEHELPEVR